MQLSTLFRLTTLAATSWLVSNAAVAADEWPQARPIQLVMSASAGSSPDILGRIVAQSLSQKLGQSIVVENKPGALGLIGNDSVARANPDGYTLLFTYAATIVGNVLLNPNMPHDPQKDLVPIAQIGSGGNLLVVSREFPVRSFQELIAEVKAHPGKYNYASWGTGSGGHIAMESIKQQTGIEMEHIPYKTMGQILTDLKGGRIPIAFVDSVSSLPLIGTGDLIPLATSGSQRSPATNNVPTMNELGVKFNADAWYGLFAPKGISPDIVAKLNAITNEVQSTPELVERFKMLNMSKPEPKSPEAFGKTIASDISTWAEVIKAANISLQ